MRKRTISTDVIRALMVHADVMRHRTYGVETSLFCEEGLVWLEKYDVIDLATALRDMEFTDFFLWAMYTYTPDFHMFHDELALCATEENLPLYWLDIVEKLEWIYERMCAVQG